MNEGRKEGFTRAFLGAEGNNITRLGRGKRGSRLQTATHQPQNTAHEFIELGEKGVTGVTMNAWCRVWIKHCDASRCALRVRVTA
jgi:hypothetical protein